MKETKRIILYSLVTVLCIYILIFSPRAQQEKELEKSNKDKANIAKLIEKDERFQEIKFHRSSNWKKPLILMGEVEKKEDLESLKQTVSKVKLESKVDYRITIKKED